MWASYWWHGQKYSLWTPHSQLIAYIQTFKWQHKTLCVCVTCSLINIMLFNFVSLIGLIGKSNIYMCDSVVAWLMFENNVWFNSLF